MDDPTIRRNVGLLCLAAVSLLLGLALMSGADEGAAHGLGVALAALGFFAGLLAVGRIGVHYFRG